MAGQKLRLRCADLFAGIGGIRLGFERAAGDGNIETVFVSELDRFAATTYANNFNTPTERICGADNLLMDVQGATIYGDITKVTDDLMSSIPQLDICLAGFPCQAFSLAGKKLGFEDDYKGMARGTLFREIIRLCDKQRPKVVFCENVKGLTHHDGGRTYEVIKGAFEQADYQVFSEVLNSKNFDVPQNRERIYMVAIRKDLGITSFTFPTGKETEKRIKDILEEDPVGSKYYLAEGYYKTLKSHRERHEKKGNGFGYQIKGPEDFASTLSCGGMGRERNLVIDSREHPTGLVPGKHSVLNAENVRFMTPREWARLQGFDDSFELPVSDVHLYKQLGNTVTVNVIEAIAEKILQSLQACYARNNFSKVLEGKIIEELEKGPCTRGELEDRLDHLFLSSLPKDARLTKIGNRLQSLKAQGVVSMTGSRRSAVWHLTARRPDRPMSMPSQR